MHSKGSVPAGGEILRQANFRSVRLPELRVQHSELHFMPPQEPASHGRERSTRVLRSWAHAGGCGLTCSSTVASLAPSSVRRILTYSDVPSQGESCAVPGGRILGVGFRPLPERTPIAVGRNARKRIRPSGWAARIAAARTERRAPGAVRVAGHTRPVDISAYELSMPLGASLRTGPKSPSDLRSGWQRVGRRPSTES